MLFPIFTNVSNIEALWQIKIDLNCWTLPGFAQCALKLNVYFGPIKYTLSGVYFISNLGMLQRLAQGIGSFFPGLNGTSVFLRSGRK